MKIRDVLHRSSLPGFIVLQEKDEGIWWMAKINNKSFSVIASVHKYSDDKHWVHLSFALKNKMPTYDDITWFKRWIIGPDKKAIQIHPAEDEHINTHEFCLHLGHRVDGDNIPDFRIAGEI